MQTFKEFYVEKELESLLEYGPGTYGVPGMPSHTNTFDYITDIAKEKGSVLPDEVDYGGFISGLVEKGMSKVLSGVSVFFGAKLLGKLIKFLLKKNNETIERVNDETRDSKMMELGIKISELEKKSKDLTDEQIDNLKSELSEKLAEKYPQKKQGWWATLLNKMGDFLDSDVGAGLAVLAFLIV